MLETLRNRIRPTADLVVIASFVLTALAATAVWQARQTAFGQQLSSRSEGPKQSPAAIAARFASEVEGMTQPEIKTMAQTLIVGMSPPLTLQTVRMLRRHHREPAAQTLAVFLSEIGAKMWNDRPLLRLAGEGYASGDYVGRNYSKAVEYLSHPTSLSSRDAQFLLGLVLLADDNPDRDPKRGVELVRKAANAGYAPAVKRLKALGEQ